MKLTWQKRQSEKLEDLDRNQTFPLALCVFHGKQTQWFVRIAKSKLGYGVMVSTTDFGSVSLGSSPSSPTNLTNMEEIEKINIINKRLRQKEARADWKWVNDGRQFGWARGRSKNRKSKRGYEVGTKESRKLERKRFKNIYHKILFHIPLTEEESNSLEFHYKWREQTHMIQALINDIRSKL